MALHSELFSIRALEVNPRREVNLLSIVNFLQEAAFSSADQLGVSVYLLQEKQLTWVLSRMYLEMYEYPLHGQSIEVETFPSGMDRFYCYRDFRLYNTNRKLIGKATSTWPIMDMQARKMVAIPAFISEMFPSHTHEAMPQAKSKIKIPPQFEYERSFGVRWHDLDINYHVNNGYFFQWAIEALPYTLLTKRSLRSIDLIFRAEARLEDRLLSKAASAGPNAYVHQIVRVSDQKEIAQALTTWQN